MTAAVEITPEMVLAVAKISRARAERIAVYATRRIGGMYVVDAARECGLPVPTAHSYEKWVRAVCARHGLTEPPKRGGIPLPSRQGYAGAGRSGGHQTHHVQRGIVSPVCPLCQGDAS